MVGSTTGDRRRLLGIARRPLRALLPGGDRSSGAPRPPGPASPTLAVRDRHLRLADLALLPPPEAGDHPLGLAPAPVRVRVQEPAALQAPVSQVPEERDQLLPRGPTHERGGRAAAEALATPRRLAQLTDETVTPCVVPGASEMALVIRGLPSTVGRSQLVDETPAHPTLTPFADVEVEELDLVPKTLLVSLHQSGVRVEDPEGS